MAKKKKKTHPKEIQADKPDLTPMIDITFQLVVFFLVANDLTRKEIEEVALPQALAGGQDLGEDLRIIINILPPPDANNPPKFPNVKVKGKSYDLKKLERFMKTQADRKREGDGGPNAPSAVFVLVRADKSSPWQHVQYVMQACAAPGVAIYKMQFATTKRDDGTATAASGN